MIQEHFVLSSQLTQKSKTALKLEVWFFFNVTEKDGMAPVDWVATGGLSEEPHLR